MTVSFSAAEAKSDYALVVRGYRKSFGERVLLEDAGFDLLAGERAAIVGPNGSGKTSFLRDLVIRAEAGSELRWDSGEAIRVGPSMRLGYCAQEQEVFPPGKTVGESFAELGAKADEAYRLLRLYLFDRAILDADAGLLSGGERNRLQIARAVFLGANFLVLDEPTNHLDIPSREALEEGLADFPGSILAVSHDRWFLEKVASRIILLEGGRFVAYEGSFAEYWRDSGKDAARGSRATGRAAGAAGRRPGIEDRGRAVRGPAPTPAGDDGERRRMLEDRITSLEGRKAELERASASAGVSRDYESAGKAAQKAKEASAMLERLYAEWESLG